MKFLGTAPSQVPTNADLGTMSTQNADDVNITGGFSYNSNKTAANYYNDTTITDTKPSLVLDFANSKALDPRVTFTRASTATYYDGKSSAVAEQNLFAYSQDFTNSAWNATFTGTLISQNAVIAPDGSLTGSLINCPTALTYRFYRATGGSSTYRFSVYAKAGTGQYLQLYHANSYSATFDLVNGTFYEEVLSTTQATMTLVNGWYRCSIVAPSATYVYINLVSVYNSTRAANGTTGNFYLWGAQLEQRTQLTDYTPTTTAAITNYIPTLQTAAAGVPRFDHDPITGESKGLLIEEQRTNLLTYSDQFDNAAWYKASVAVTPNTYVSPDGTLSGDVVVHTAATGEIGYNTTSVNNAATYTFTIYAKYVNNPWVRLLIANSVSVGTVWFNLQTGLLGSAQSSTGAIQSVGNGWYRCSITVTVSAGTSGYVSVIAASADASGTRVNGGSWVSWGAQLEVGAFPTSYIPTTASTATRSTDSASITGANFSSWYNPSEGTIVSESSISRVYDTARCIVDIGDNTNNNRISTITTGSSATLLLAINANGINYVSTGSIMSASGTKFAGVYTNGYFSASVNGTSATPATSGVIPTVNQMGIGKITTGSSIWCGYIKKISYYPKRLQDSELQEMTQ